MTTKSIENKHILTRIFESPKELFVSYFIKDGEVPFKELTLLHFLLWVFAPFFRFIHNLISVFILPWLWEGHRPVKLTSSLLVSFLIYPIFYILILQVDTIRLHYRNPMQKKEIPHVLSLSFIPFSASFIFWIFPFPLNTIFIFFAFLYSVWLSYLSLQIASEYKLKQFMELLVISCIYFLTLALVFNILFHVYRELR